MFKYSNTIIVVPIYNEKGSGMSITYKLKMASRDLEILENVSRDAQDHSHSIIHSEIPLYIYREVRGR